MFQFLRDFCDQDFDVAIFGLGFESRSVSALEHFRYKISSVKVLGYHKNTDQFSYQANREIFKQYTDDIIEVCDDELHYGLISNPVLFFKLLNRFISLKSLF